MKITDVRVVPFRTTVKRFSNGTPQPKLPMIQTLTRIETDDGATGHYFGGHGHGDQDGMDAVSQAFVTSRLRDLLVGRDPFDREQFWHWMWAAKTPEHLMGVIDMALWDLAGNVANLPVAKLMGGARDRVRAYASTYPNLGSIDDYVSHAIACREEGYQAYKIHPYYFWNPETRQPAPGRPSHIRHDIELIHAVADAVGDTMTLMYDPWGTYHIYEEALAVGRELESRGYHWYEHPMPEHRLGAYQKLAAELSIPICSPEILEGHVFTRAEWIRQEASDISRIDVLRGGITAARKTAITCEAFGVRCEIHMSGIGNLHVLGATSDDTCEYYERGLLAPGVDYDAPLAYLNAPLDPMDAEGYVSLPTRPGLGYDIIWDYVEENRVTQNS